MLEWGLEQADRMKCNTYVEANVHGEKLYRKFGFVSTLDVQNPRKLHADDEWRELEYRWPLRFRWMVRPAHGDLSRASSYHKGKSLESTEHHFQP